MMNRKSLVIAVGVVGLMVVGCEEKKATPPKVTPPPAPKAPTGATVPTTPPSAPTAPTTPPAAPK